MMNSRENVQKYIESNGRIFVVLTGEKLKKKIHVRDKDEFHF